MSNNYENAPATKMLATRCAVCTRPLLDSFSVEVGIGPICRQRHGWDEEVRALGEDARKAANAIVYRVALAPDDEAIRASACAALRLMGFKKLPDRIEYRGDNAPTDEVVEVRPHTLPARAAGYTPAGRGHQRWSKAMPAVEGYIVSTPYKPNAVQCFRAIPGRVWVRERKANFIPRTQREALWALLRANFGGMALVTATGTSVVPTPEVAAFASAVRAEREASVRQRMEVIKDEPRSEEPKKPDGPWAERFAMIEL